MKQFMIVEKSTCRVMFMDEEKAMYFMSQMRSIGMADKFKCIEV